MKWWREGDHRGSRASDNQMSSSGPCRPPALIMAFASWPLPKDSGAAKEVSPEMDLNLTTFLS